MTYQQSKGAKTWSRRRFLRFAGCTALSAPLWAACSSLGPAPRSSGPAPAKPRLQHACIGVGGAGAADLEAFADDSRVRVVALCDVDQEALERASQTTPEARVYNDYREMFRGEGARLHSVSVAVPAHMHFAIVAGALRAGKHVCCHGLIGHDVAELRAFRRLEAHNDLVLMAEPRAATQPYTDAVTQWLSAGRLGLVTRVYLVTGNPVADNFRVEGPRPGTGEAPPENLAWNLWIGTAPYRSYAPGLYHPARWRSWQDFGTGPAMDDLQDLFYPVWRGLGLGSPVSVLSEPEPAWSNSEPRRADTWPLSAHVTWTFPGNDRTGVNEIAVDWYDGESRPPDRVFTLAGFSREEFPPGAALVLGTEGTLLLRLAGIPTLRTRGGTFKGAEARPARTTYQRYIEACFDSQPWRTNFQESTLLAETLLLANVGSHFPGVKLNWNAQQGTFAGQPEANRHLSRTYRDGWHIGPF